MDLSPVTIEDITLHSDYVNVLIEMYSDLIDEYKFDVINQLIYKNRSKFNKLLHEYNENNTNPIPIVNKFGRQVEDGCFIAWTYLIQTIFNLDDPASIFENYINANLNRSNSSSPFEHAIVDHCGTIKAQRIIPKLFDYVTFKCDIHIQTGVLDR